MKKHIPLFIISLFAVFVVGAYMVLNHESYNELATITTVDTPTPQLTEINNGIKQDVPIGLKAHKHIGGKFQIVTIKNGTNKIDLNNDGVMDTVFMSKRENGTSPHGYSIYNFSIYTPPLAVFSSDTNSYWHSVIVWKGYKDSKDDNALYYNVLTTTEGADGFLEDIRLIKGQNQKPILVIARKDFGDSYADSQVVRFHFYDLVENTDGEDLSSNYSYKYRDTAVATSKYTDVNEAMDKELANKY